MVILPLVIVSMDLDKEDQNDKSTEKVLLTKCLVGRWDGQFLSSQSTEVTVRETRHAASQMIEVSLSSGGWRLRICCYF